MIMSPLIPNPNPNLCLLSINDDGVPIQLPVIGWIDLIPTPQGYTILSGPVVVGGCPDEWMYYCRATDRAWEDYKYHQYKQYTQAEAVNIMIQHQVTRLTKNATPTKEEVIEAINEALAII
jgi:hypothetical protein